MRSKRPTPRVLSWLLRPPALLYGGIIRARNCYYDRVAGAVLRSALPVISVGNITVGGTGKTPLVIEVVRRLHALGRHPAILTRGYKATPGQEADEVLEFRTALGDVAIVVNPDRVAGAATAEAQPAVDCLVLDDGFQHRRLARDLDIVVLDALDPWGRGAMLPAGRLREPLAGLRRADLFVINRANQVPPEHVLAITDTLHRRGATQPIVTAAIEPDALVLDDTHQLPPTALAGQRVLAVCGLGNPDTFVRLVASLAGAIETAIFADHQHYAPDRVSTIQAAAQRMRATMVVTTRKDWVKLAPLWVGNEPPLARLDVRVVLQSAADAFDACLRRVMERRR